MAEDHVEFLKEYNEWMGQRKLLARDISPEAFVIDRAKDEALDRLIVIERYIDNWQADLDYVPEPGENEIEIDYAWYLRSIQKVIKDEG